MLMQEGQGVILKRELNLKYVCISEIGRVHMGNFSFACRYLIGCVYGSAFRVLNNGCLEQIDPILVEKDADEYLKEGLESCQELAEKNDNRNIIDDVSSQKLGKQDILACRSSGKTGEEIVEHLVENSATFQERTLYSQAKYLKKKRKKYLAHFVALFPSARLLAEMYFTKQPAKVLNMRPDSLGQLLTWSGVHGSSRVLLVENCQGLLLGAVLERLEASGHVAQVYMGNPVRLILHQFNIASSTFDSVISSFPYEYLVELKSILETCKDEDVLQKLSFQAMSVKDSCKLGNGTPDSDNAENAGFSKKMSLLADGKPGGDSERNSQSLQQTATSLSQRQRLAEATRAFNHFRERSFDSLLIASKYHPKSVVLNTLPFLRVACPFAVYCEHKEPLMDCFITLKETGVACGMELSETWLRPIQVLPDRTHPEIVMSSCGGYILRGLKVAVD